MRNIPGPAAGHQLGLDSMAGLISGSTVFPIS